MIKKFFEFKQINEDVKLERQRTRLQLIEIIHELNIRKYQINEDFTVDVEGDVVLTNKSLKELPLKFGIVEGSFYCSHNQLTSLVGAPYQVDGDFFCNINNLTSLIGGPQLVKGDFFCNINDLTSLVGAPTTVWDFDCDNNQLITLTGIPTQIGGDFYCYNNPVAEVWKLFNYDSKFLEVFDMYNLFQIPGVIDSAAIEEIAKHLDQTLPENWTLKKYQVI